MTVGDCGEPCAAVALMTEAQAGSGWLRLAQAGSGWLRLAQVCYLDNEFLKAWLGHGD